jgi:hypothetical protein
LKERGEGNGRGVTIRRKYIRAQKAAGGKREQDDTKGNRRARIASSNMRQF